MFLRRSSLHVPTQMAALSSVLCHLIYEYVTTFMVGEGIKWLKALEERKKRFKDADKKKIFLC